MIIDQSVIDMIRNHYPLSVAQDIIGVQPMGPVDWEALGDHPLWRSFCSRHFPNPDEVAEPESDER